MSQLTQQIHDLFSQVLHLTDAFDDDTPFIELGGQSILMGELKSRMEQLNLLLHLTVHCLPVNQL